MNEKEPRIIAVETSGPHGSVALARGPDLIAQRPFRALSEHARELLPTADRLCRECGWAPCDLDQCHLSIGPGSFTGLRVAVAFARHMALATGAAICAVPTLDVIAENCADLDDPPRRLAVILDAKRKQVYAAVYEYAAGAYRRAVEPHLVTSEALLDGPTKPTAVVGDGIEKHRAAIEAAGVTLVDPPRWRPQASHVHRLGWRLAQQDRFTPPSALVPFYLRRPEAEEVWEKRHGAAPK